MADPQGNEFCVLEPRPIYRVTGPIAAVVVDCTDPRGMARFWGKAMDWTVHEVTDDHAAMRSAKGVGPYLEFLRTPDTKSVWNRVHLDVCPYPVTTWQQRKPDCAPWAPPTPVSTSPQSPGRFWPTRKATSSASSPLADLEQRLRPFSGQRRRPPGVSACRRRRDGARGDPARVIGCQEGHERAVVGTGARTSPAPTTALRAGLRPPWTAHTAGHSAGHSAGDAVPRPPAAHAGTAHRETGRTTDAPLHGPAATGRSPSAASACAPAASTSAASTRRSRGQAYRRAIRGCCGVGLAMGHLPASRTVQRVDPENRPLGYLYGTKLTHCTGFMPCAGSAAHGRGAGAPLRSRRCRPRPATSRRPG